MIERRAFKTPQAIAERPIAPHQLVAIKSSRHSDDLPPERAELMDPILERGSDTNAVAIKPGNVVDAVLQAAVAEHVVDQAAHRDRDSVACLLDTLDVAFHAAVDHLPPAS